MPPSSWVEQILPETISKHMEGKKGTRKSQGKPWLTSLVAFWAMDNRKVYNIYTDHGKVFVV